MNPKTIIKIITYLVYAIVIVVPLIFFKTGMYPFGIIKVVLFQSLAEIILVLWLALIIFYKEYRPNKSSLILAMTIFMLVATLSSWLGSDWRTGLWTDESRSLGLVALWHFAALFLVLVSLKDRLNWKVVWLLSFGTAFLVSLTAFIQFLGLFPHNSILYIENALTAGARVGSTFSNAGFMAGYLILNFFVGLYLTASQATKSKEQTIKNIQFWFFCVGTALIAGAILLSQTMGAIVGLFVGLLFAALTLLWRSPSPGVRKSAIAVLAILILLPFVFWLTIKSPLWQSLPGPNRFASASLESPSIRDRLIAWKVGWEAFKQKPVLGWGWGDFRIAFNKNYDPRILKDDIQGTYWDKAHNTPLEYLTTTGILGFLAYLGIFGAAFYTLFKKTRINTDKKLINADENISINQQYRHELVVAAPFLGAGLVAYFVQNIFTFDTIGTYLMFFLVLAYIDSNYATTQINTDKERIYTDNKSALISQHPYFFTSLIVGLLLLSSIPIYYNIQIFNASRYEYWGVNYFLNLMPADSLSSFERALNTPTPYSDDIKRTFANVIKQAHQQGIDYPDVMEVQKRAVMYLEEVIARHPEEYLNYLALADFKQTFWQYNKSYIAEAENLAEQSLLKSPNRQQIYYVLARNRLLQGNTAGAYEIFRKTVGLNPAAAEPHFYFGLLAYGVGDIQTGREEIAKAEALGRTPERIEEAVNLGNFVGDYEGDYAKAIQLYNLALSLVAQKPVQDSAVTVNLRQNVLLKLAVAYYLDGDKEAARQKFLELKGEIDFKALPIYPQLQPVLKELGVE